MDRRNYSAVVIQSAWKGYITRKAIRQAFESYQVRPFIYLNTLQVFNNNAHTKISDGRKK